VVFLSIDPIAEFSHFFCLCGSSPWVCFSASSAFNAVSRRFGLSAVAGCLIWTRRWQESESFFCVTSELPRLADFGPWVFRHFGAPAFRHPSISAFRRLSFEIWIPNLFEASEPSRLLLRTWNHFLPPADLRLTGRIRAASGQRLKFFRAVVPKLRSRAGEGQSDAPPVSALQPSACQHSMR
jgi:hypothetical protein